MNSRLCAFVGNLFVLALMACNKPSKMPEVNKKDPNKNQQWDRAFDQESLKSDQFDGKGRFVAANVGGVQEPPSVELTANRPVGGRQSMEALPFCDMLPVDSQQPVFPRPEILFPSKSVGRYDSLEVPFSLLSGLGEEGEKPESSVRENLRLLDAQGNPVAGAVYWGDESSTSVVFDPYQPLEADSNYTLDFVQCRDGDSDPLLSVTNKRSIAPLKKSFRTGSSFTTVISINGHLLSPKSGFFLDLSKEQRAWLDISIQDAQKLQKVSIEKLGRNLASLTLCDKAAGEACSEDLSLDLLTSRQLVIKPGANSYLVKMVTKEGKKIQRTFDFVAGDLSHDPSQSMKAGGLFVDGGPSMESLSKMLSGFISGDFTINIDGKPTTFNEILKRNMGRKSTSDINCTMEESEGEESEGEESKGFDYLTMVGPFEKVIRSNRAGILPYKVEANVYLTSFEIEEKSGNIQVDMKTNDGRLDLVLKGQEIEGELMVHLHVLEGPMGLSGSNHLFAIPIEMNLSDGWAKAYANTELTKFEGEKNLDIKVRGGDVLDLLQPSTDPSLNAHGINFDVTEWVQHMVAKEPKNKCGRRTGIFITQAIKDILRAEIEPLKPVIMNGAILDVVQKVSPFVMNALLEQTQGVKLAFGKDLPPPLPKLGLTIDGDLETMAVLDGLGLSSQLRARFGVGVKSEQPPPKEEALQSDGDHLGMGVQNGEPLPEEGALQSDGDQLGVGIQRKEFLLELGALPSHGDQRNFPLFQSDYVFDMRGFLASQPDDPKSTILALNPDLLNQAVFHLWRNGGLDVTFDEDLYNDLVKESPSGSSQDSSQNRIFEELFKVGSFVGMLNLETDRQVSGISGVKISDEDAARFVMEAPLPPIIELLPSSVGELTKPTFRLSVPGLVMTVKGSSTEGEDYTLASFKSSLVVEASIGVGPRKEGGHAVSVDLDVASASYAIEALSGVGGNPFGFDTAVLTSKVSELFGDTLLPMMEDLLAEIPLEDTSLCGAGVDLAGVRLGSYTDHDNRTSLVASLPLKASGYEGHCGRQNDALEEKNPSKEPKKLPHPIGHRVDDFYWSFQQCEGVKPIQPETPPACRLRPNLTSSKFVMKIPEDVATGIGHWDILTSDLEASGVDPSCRADLFRKGSCSKSYVNRTADDKYKDTLIHLYKAVPKSDYTVENITERFLNFDRWKEYAEGQGSVEMTNVGKVGIVEQGGRNYHRQYSNYKVDSPIGFVKTIAVTDYRILESPFKGSQLSAVYGTVAAPAGESLSVLPGEASYQEPYNLKYQYGFVNVLDCSKLSWCPSGDYWILVYDTYIRPEIDLLPESAAPYIESSLNGLIRGMFK